MRYGITIQQRVCPWCHNRLTVRVANGQSICFNCGHHWHGQSPFENSGAPVDPGNPPVPFLFGSAATARLEVYRMAVRAGFYTERRLPARTR